MKHNYRYDARSHLKDAKDELSKSGYVKARSTALCLRMCMESLTYERAQLYQDDLPKEVYETWQPRKLMKQIIEIDPTAYEEMTLKIGGRTEPEANAEVMRHFGTEKPISQKTIKKHYDALGAYMHEPSIKQIKEGKQRDESKLRQRCALVIEELEKCLSSTMWACDIKFSATTDCKCGEKLTRRISDKQDSRTVTCHNCNSRYTLTGKGNGKVEWQPHDAKIVCADDGCGGISYVQEHLIKPGARIKCFECEMFTEVIWGLRLVGSSGKKIPPPPT